MRTHLQKEGLLQENETSGMDLSTAGEPNTERQF